MSRRKVDTAKMQEMFSKSHELGAAKFGGIWLMANRQAIRACVDVGLDYTAPQMKALLSMAAWNILLNVHEAIASVHESRDPQAVRAGEEERVMSELCKICKCHMMGPETLGNVCNHCLDVRGNMFNRMDGLMAMRRTGKLSKRSEMAGFLSIIHPELSDEQRARLAKEAAEE